MSNEDLIKAIDDRIGKIREVVHSPLLSTTEKMACSVSLTKLRGEIKGLGYVKKLIEKDSE